MLLNKFSKKKRDKIRVGFIIQELAVLNKSLLLIEQLMKDNRFQVVLLCVPSNILDGKLVNQVGNVNDVFDYLNLRGYRNLVNTLDESNNWINIEKFNLDYIFYNRPYDSVYPEPYRSKTVSKYTKICVVLYAFTMVKKVLEITLNKGFFKYVYFYFAESNESCNYNIDRFYLMHKLGLQKSIYLGMPVFELFFRYKRNIDKSSQLSHSWSFSKNKFRVIWTPRWTTDYKLGGSNFFTYIMEFLDYADRNKEIDFLMRPHPLMFENFLKTKELAFNEYKQLIDRIDKMDNFSIDNEKEYVSTFYQSDILVTDISSIISEYILTGKPIIYCKNNMHLELVSEAKVIIDACYTVSDFQEITNCIENILRGNDSLKDRRVEIVSEVYGVEIKNSTKLIVEELVKDYLS